MSNRRPWHERRKPADGDGTVTPDEVDSFARRARRMLGGMRGGNPMGGTSDQN